MSRSSLAALILVVSCGADVAAQDVIKPRDSLWNGILIGAGTSAAASFIVYPHALHKAQTAAVAAAFGAVWGAWVDAQIKSKRLVYSVGPTRVQLRLRF